MNKTTRLVRFSCSSVIVASVIASAARAAEPRPVKKGDWPMWGGGPDRNMVSDEKGIPEKWDIKSGLNIKWKAPLGSQSFGNPVIAGGKIYVGTNNVGEYRAHSKGDKGIELCFDEKTGKLLWQATHDKLPTGLVNDWPEQGICSTACAEGNRVYYVSNRAELVCADTEGFMDNENDGPFTEEQWKESQDADFVWLYDMIDELGAFPHNLATSSPVIVDDLIYVITSNGVDEGHLNMPSPDAPDFIAVNKKTGKLAWDKNYPKRKVLHGQWSSPSYSVIAGRPQVIFPGGDGWVYSLNPKDGEILWKFDMNPKDSVYVLGGRGTRNEIISTPVIYDNKVYVAVGQDPEHGEGIGHLYAIDATKSGDVTESGKVWHVGGEDFHRTISTVAIDDGLVYATDLSGYLYCFDAKTGQKYWRYDTQAAIWGSPYVVDGKVMIGDEDGKVVVLQTGKTMKEIATNDMGNSVYSTPVAANGTLYIANRRMLYAISAKK